MTTYAGFTDLGAYIDARLLRDGMTRRQLCRAVGKHFNYIPAIIKGDFSPSAQMCDTIAGVFRDDPHVVRVLAGKETPEPVQKRALREIMALASALDESGQQEAVKYLEYLTWKSRPNANAKKK